MEKRLVKKEKLEYECPICSAVMDSSIAFIHERMHIREEVNKNEE